MNQPTPEPVLLGLLAVQPCHGYQLLEVFHDPDELGRVWNMSTSQLYAVLKRLEQQEFITGVPVQVPDAPTRTEYHLTEAGRDALDLWLHDSRPSASVRRVRIEFLSRLYIARLLNIPTIPIVRAQKAACEHQLKMLQVQEEQALPGVGYLALEFMIAQLHAVLQWIDRCEVVPLVRPEEE
ncbi:MAG TPA: PadR family transcriptional regulator [Aggregatilinea sp.]|jgi:PadR family transcriptional regulator AphA|uniref:PadR family transcriptional regulator n=1 Tax=Aggregatilinea sp. TaxID=2806333 RepID=UPI002CCE5F52|nr:PadR family transcriptional regulator [Aggregatilinea sp.]HML21324.1 PadR family transcriptional regulator [Aggregatilinea sp.]